MARTTRSKSKQLASTSKAKTSTSTKRKGKRSALREISNEAKPKTRPRRNTSKSKAQIYREVSSDEEEEVTRSSSSVDDDNDYSSSEEDNHNSSTPSIREKDKKKNVQETKVYTASTSIRFSLPSLDESFTEPIRDWRSTGAIDY